MKKTSMVLTAFTVLFLAASNTYPAKADTIVMENSSDISNESAAKESIPGVSEVYQPGTITLEDGETGVTAPASGDKGGEAAPMGAGLRQFDPEPAVPQLSKGQQAAAYASQFIGNPYVYGGTSLTNGADCSGFVMRVYEKFGVSLPRTSKEQGRAGTDVGGIENAQPGDIVSYKGHIGIYRGQNQLVHASNPKSGITVSPVTYKPILSVRRVV